jgi:DNA (cytosine-5)-methyltransferase 1
MLSPQFMLPLAQELVIDLFAGGGGASTGIEQAIDRHVDVAVNHDPQAVALHQANHPQTRHFVSDVFEVDPLAVTDGQPVGLLWASPDCKHFSKAKGGKPVSKKIRGLAWVVIKWAKLVRPRVICLENVEEFQTWGPLDANDMPCQRRKGQTFQRWVAQLRNLGYQVEWRELRACDYGAPTIRKRLFLVARRDGAPIVWPKPTHAAKPAKGSGLQPWRTAAECIDWSIPCPSIFERERPLADATLRRIAHGIKRYVIDAPKPFIAPVTHPGDARVNSIDEPMRTITGANRGEKALIAPTIARIGQTGGNGKYANSVQEPVSTITSKAEHLLVSPTLVQTGYGERPGQAPRVPGLDKPLGTAVDGQKHALVAAFLAKHYGGVVGSPLPEPIGTVTSVDHHSLVAAHLVGVGGRQGQGQSPAYGADRPARTVTAKGDTAIVAASLAKLRGTSSSADAAQPLHTISAQGEHHALVSSHLMTNTTGHAGGATDAPLHTITTGGHHAEVRALLLKYYGTDQDPDLREPLHTVTTKDRFGLVTVEGEDYLIADIGMRMLQPRELYRAQGFPDAYIIDRGADGVALPKSAQVRMCGNSVCPPLSAALVRANYAEQALQRRAA